MYGKTSTEKGIVDQMMDTCLDLYDPFVNAMMSPDKDEKVFSPRQCVYKYFNTTKMHVYPSVVCVYMQKHLCIT